jgi:ACS family hexuronate transporter-like MFS transporter
MRWYICALLFFATTINYVDRQILGILAVTLQKEFGWSESEYGLLVTAFNAAYALGLLGFGRIIDTVGVRAGYVLSIGLWSVAACLHGLASSVLQFGAARFLLGLGEAGNFPAAVKTVSEWFAARERALAVGVFNCGSNIGAIVTPLIVPWIVLHYGWRAAFFITGATGFVWIAAWLFSYSAPPRQAQDGPAPRPVPFRRLLRHRETWAWVTARFLTDPVWWFYLYWIPKFLYSQHGLTLDRIGLPLVTIYLAADAGSVCGGWLSSALLRRGWSINAARKTAILVCALMVTPMMFADGITDLWVAVAVISLAAAGHQGWAANMFASLADTYPKPAVSSIIGITGFGGSVGGMLVAAATGFLLDAMGTYKPVFIWAGMSYLVVLALIHLVIPKLARVEIDQDVPIGHEDIGTRR